MRKWFGQPNIYLNKGVNMNPLKWLPGGTGNIFWDVATWWFFRPKSLGSGTIPEGFKDPTKTKKHTGTFEIEFTIPPLSSTFWNFIPWVNNVEVVNNNITNNYFKRISNNLNFKSNFEKYIASYGNKVFNMTSNSLYKLIVDSRVRNYAATH
jgi:hypothetical protein